MSEDELTPGEDLRLTLGLSRQQWATLIRKARRPGCYTHADDPFHHSGHPCAACGFDGVIRETRKVPRG